MVLQPRLSHKSQPHHLIYMGDIKQYATTRNVEKFSGDTCMKFEKRQIAAWRLPTTRWTNDSNFQISRR